MATGAFADVLRRARESGPRTIAVAAAADPDILSAVAAADREGLARAFLVGDAAAIRRLAPTAGLDLGRHQVVDAPDLPAAAAAAVRLVSGGQAGMLMKGMLPTAVLMGAVLNREWGLRTAEVICHITVFELPAYPKLLFIADTGLLPSPNLDQKVSILKSAASLARRIGVARPRVAVLAAIETVRSDMPATTDAAALKAMGERGDLGDCVVDGPLALDLAVSSEAAAHKGFVSPVAGAADVLIVPDVQAGNILYKALVYLAGARVAGVVLGGAAPMVMLSRADRAEDKLYSIAFALAGSGGEGADPGMSAGPGTSARPDSAR